MNKQTLIEKALANGIETIEIYTQKSSKESIEIYDQKVDSFTIAQSGGIAVRGLYNGKLGNCFLEEDSDDNFDLIIDTIKSNATLIENDDIVKIYEGSKEYPTIESSKLIKTSTEEKIEFLKQIETKLSKADKRIVQVMGTMMETQQVEVNITNSLGMDITKNEEYCIFYASVLASNDGDNKSAYEIKVTHDINSINVDEYVEVLKEKVVSKLNAKQVKSDKYKVIIKNDAMTSLLGALTGLFNGENVYKGISQLKDKMDTQIFDEKITILDNPLKKDGFASTPFDDEGVASKTKVIVDKGVLKLFLHNQKSAAMMNTESTGNGFKRGYSSSVGISPTNFYIEQGNLTFKELCKEMNNGLIIDELNGLHAGLNPISTDFSLQASGYVVENGEIVRPVNLITVAGNFLNMMKKIENLSNDTYDGLSGVSSPSILFDNLSISGE